MQAASACCSRTPRVTRGSIAPDSRRTWVRSRWERRDWLPAKTCLLPGPPGTAGGLREVARGRFRRHASHETGAVLRHSRHAAPGDPRTPRGTEDGWVAIGTVATMTVVRAPYCRIRTGGRGPAPEPLHRLSHGQQHPRFFWRLLIGAWIPPTCIRKTESGPGGCLFEPSTSARTAYCTRQGGRLGVRLSEMHALLPRQVCAKVRIGKFGSEPERRGGEWEPTAASPLIFRLCRALTPSRFCIWFVRGQHTVRGCGLDRGSGGVRATVH